MTDTPTPGEAAALPTIEAIMELANKLESEAVYATQSGNIERVRIARETLRAALARALPVGEERDAARWRTMRHRFVAVEWDWGGGDNGTGIAVALFEIDPTLQVFSGPECADAFADCPFPAMAPKGTKT